jgi:hypothetical protein
MNCYQITLERSKPAAERAAAYFAEKFRVATKVYFDSFFRQFAVNAQCRDNAEFLAILKHHERVSTLVNVATGRRVRVAPWSN